MSNKIVEIAGMKLPLTSCGSNENILCKDSKNFFPLRYANKTQAQNKVLKLSSEGINSQVVYPGMFAMGYKINIVIGI